MSLTHPTILSNTVRLRIFVGWVEQSETQQMSVNVGFRPSTQPTQFHDFELNRKVLQYYQLFVDIYTEVPRFLASSLEVGEVAMIRNFRSWIKTQISENV